ncbi:Dyp-type peroxidase [Oceanospirillum sanctuarii]|uniref:Dyp-type peroxidase n=1 Tax=Oceanospirillum sanctuarii TaxID=1434821 RepID=UPI000A3766D4|nr:Dyp-type peroxidase [Oceanospirillum sanctuarii]
MQDHTLKNVQSGILAESNQFGYYITYTLSPDDDLLPLVRDMVARFPSMIDECGRVFDVPSLNGVVAISSDAWDRLYPEGRPAALKSFPEMKQGARVAPETPCDLYFQIRSDRHDINFIVARRIDGMLGEIANLQEAIPTFRYLDSRDLTGFVDGTENPQGEDRAKVALVGNEDQAFAGGSYVHLQRYVHNMPVWNGVPVKEQEQVIGRTKAENIEFEGEEKPLTSHIKRAGIKDEEGSAIEILRQSMPYGNLSAQGLYFVSYCRFADNFTRMLASMIYSDTDGHYDHMLKYTEAVTGAALFAPSREFLAKYVGAAAEAEQLKKEKAEAEAKRLAEEEAELNSTRSELAYTPLSEAFANPDAVNPVEPEVDPDAETEKKVSDQVQTPEVAPEAAPEVKSVTPTNTGGRRYSASFYQAMLEDDEEQRQSQQETPDNESKNLKQQPGLPWTLTEEGKKGLKDD